MHRQQQRRRTAVAGDQVQDAVVIDLGEAQPPVLPGNLDAEQAKIFQAVDHRAGDLLLPVDPVGIHLLPQKIGKLCQHGVPGGLFARVLLRPGKDQVGSQSPHEELAEKTRLSPLSFPRRLGDRQGMFVCWILCAHGPVLYQCTCTFKDSRHLQDCLGETGIRGRGVSLPIHMFPLQRPQALCYK